MKLLILAAVIGLAFSSPGFMPQRENNKVGTSFDEVVDIISGVLVGIGEQANATQVVSCINDVDKVVFDMESAVNEIKKWTWDSVKAGIHDLATGLDVVPTAMDDCVGGAGELSAIMKKMLYNFEHPISYFFKIEYHLMVNGVEILGDIKSAVADWDSKSYYNFGVSSGKALSLVFGKTNYDVGAPSAKEVLDIIGGLLDGIAAGVGLADIQGCVNDTEIISANLYNAVTLFVKKTPADVKQAIHDFGEALEFIPGAIKDCASAYENDGAKIEQMLKNFESPYSFIYHVGKNLVLNGSQIYTEMVNAIDDWKSAQYFGFGENLGMALAKTFLLPRGIAN